MTPQITPLGNGSLRQPTFVPLIRLWPLGDIGDTTMNSIQAKRILALAAIALLGGSLAGCAAATESGTAAAPESSPEASAPAAPADLTGEWRSTNSDSEDSYQSATITSDSIEINWVSDGGSTRALYWAGSYAASSESGAFSWDSQNYTEQTSAAMLASGDPTKFFSYEDEDDNAVISYEVSAMGVTKMVTLERQ